MTMVDQKVELKLISYYFRVVVCLVDSIKKKVQIQEKDESVIKDMTVTMGGLGVPSIPNHSVTVE